MPLNSWSRDVAEGAAAGFVATLPMSATLLAIHRLLPWREQTEIEPRHISEELLEKAGFTNLSKRQITGISIAAHFGYGAACGAVYGALESSIPAPRGARGPLFGLAVWTGSYAGWLPHLEILPPPEEHIASRNAMLIASHLVWGFTTGLVKGGLARRRQQTRQFSPDRADSRARVFASGTRHVARA